MQFNAPELWKFKLEVQGRSRWWTVWQGKEVSFEVTFERVKWWWDSDSSRHTVPDLWSNRGESTISKVGFVFMLGTCTCTNVEQCMLWYSSTVNQNCRSAIQLIQH